MRLTDRDRWFLEWLNGHGFCVSQHLDELFDCSRKVGSRRLKKLEDEGFIKRFRYSLNEQHIIQPTALAVTVIGDDLNEPSKPAAGTFQHDRLLIDIDIALYHQVGQTIKTERRIKSQKAMSAIGSTGHVPDGIIELDGRKTAIELELSVKGKSRLKKIMQEYQESLIRRVIYICGSEAVANAINRMADEMHVARKIETIELHKLLAKEVQLAEPV